MEKLNFFKLYELQKFHEDCPPKCTANDLGKPVCGTCGNGTYTMTYPDNCLLKHIMCSNPKVDIQWKCNGVCPCSSFPMSF